MIALLIAFPDKANNKKIIRLTEKMEDNKRNIKYIIVTLFLFVFSKKYLNVHLEI